MKRRHFLAAELFAYSFANYAAHLPVGNSRFTRLMPREAELLERAEDEGWSDKKVAEALEMEVEKVPEWRKRFRRAVEVVDAGNPADAFRAGVRFSIEDAVADGLDDPEAIERLVTQICYRAADLAFLLEEGGRTLSDFSEELRREPDKFDWPDLEGG